MKVLYFTLYLLYHVDFSTATVRENRAILEELAKDYGKVHPMFLVYLYDEMLMFVNTIHLYRGPRSDTSNKKLVITINLSPQRLYNLRTANPKFMRDLCPLNPSCEQTKKVVVFIKTEHAGALAHFIGVVVPNEKTGGKVLSMYFIRNMTDSPLEAPYYQYELFHYYRIVNEEKAYSYIVTRGKDVWARMTIPPYLEINPPKAPFRLAEHGNGLLDFGFQHTDDSNAFYSPNDRMFHFYPFVSVESIHEISPTGVEYQVIEETDKSKRIVPANYAQLRYSHKGINVSQAFNIIDAQGDKEVATVDIDFKAEKIRHKANDSMTAIIFFMIVFLAFAILAVLMFAVYIVIHKRKRRMVIEKKLPSFMHSMTSMYSGASTSNLKQGGSTGMSKAFGATKGPSSSRLKV